LLTHFSKKKQFQTQKIFLENHTLLLVIGATMELKPFILVVSILPSVVEPKDPIKKNSNQKFQTISKTSCCTDK
jgi:hypothetical protein